MLIFSHQSSRTTERGSPISIFYNCIHKISVVVFAKALYSIFVVKLARVGFIFEHCETGLEPRYTT